MKILKKVFERLINLEEIPEENEKSSIEDKSKEAIELKMMLQNTIML
ncbi:hypothetical protein BD780_001169 [Clostridium tetanomorphum]|uniref:Uncharacterized protein n=1 Tax=Clostridium tetanomorphum TaxID=1553 RepID=A0A923J035_CLOTT|nr:hypothetical protein [Clostridium tetanomorphum]MBC2397916.1 hypothetical protein [Clostridium tetanomorphum]MBP1864768.1 hypothetical protein [Clostridium tetanomorphum]NRS83944.1 hypothetical protein [Clostridium tetanomorphum]NRZ97163.1 hypothetical protein [Clostridium tetanomorphum]SQB93066.1 Uncharacterised protein [Clostridium tetanomorphum]